MFFVINMLISYPYFTLIDFLRHLFLRCDPEGRNFIPVGSLGISIDLVLPAALWPLGGFILRQK
jgi:hypothetical protein